MPHRPRRGLSTWLTSSRTPLFVLDDRNVVLVFNQGCEELTGWSAAEVIGQTCQLHTDGNPEHVESLTGLLAPPPAVCDGLPDHRRCLLIKRDGGTSEQTVSFFPLLPFDDNKRSHVLGLITARAVEPVSAPERHLEMGRHLAQLHRRYGVERLIARSPAMQRVAAQIALARDAEATVQVVGEPGSGREHVARLIHYSGRDRDRRFVPLRCRDSSPFELERTLNRLAEQSDDALPGAVYLDGVEHVPAQLHGLLVQLLNRAGLRWFSSSSRILSPETSSLPGELQYGLTSLVVSIPPLRDRSEDILLLAQQFVEECNRQRERPLEGLSEIVQRQFQLYGWPGNVEELERIILKACENANGTLVDVDDLPFEFAAGQSGEETRPVSIRVPLDQRVAEFERDQVVAALHAAKGNKSLAADELGISRPRLYRLLETLGLAEPRANDDGIVIEE